MFSRDTTGNINFKSFLRELNDWAYEESRKEDHLIGVLLCEGDENSVDKAVYEVVFPDLLIIPLGGCTTVVRYLPKVRTILGIYGLYGYAIIDRDALSKKEIKRLLSKKCVYTTKLPFIENIICTPEVLQIVLRDRGLDYELFLEKIERELVKILWQKLKEALPINLGVEKNERILSLRIGACTRTKTIEKQVNKDSILYTYRDKIITSIVASHIKIKGKRGYYNYMINLIKDERYRAELAHAFSSFIPKFEFYDLD